MNNIPKNPASTHVPKSPTGQIHTVADLAARWNLKEQKVKGETEYHGAHPKGEGADKTGFWLREDGSAYDRQLNRNYTQPEVAQELAGINPDEYAPCVEYRARNGAAAPSRPTQPKPAQNAVKPPANGTPDNASPVSLEARGLLPETLREFGVKPINGKAANRCGWKYPTHHADGKQGKTRFKNARAKSDTEAKYQWWKGGDNREPDGYNLQNVPDGAPDVWIVGGEPDVWMMSQNGFVAVATFGEGQGAAKLIAALKSKGVQRVHVALDNDDGGEKGAVAQVRECITQGMDYTDRQFQGERGHDVCNEYARAGRDRETFRAAMQSLPERAPKPTITETANINSAGIETPTRRFPRVGLREIFERPRLDYLIDGIFIEKGTGVISANYGSYKSFIALDMGLCVATGRDWVGREVKRGNVVYVTPEGSYTIKDRVKAWMIRHNIQELPENFEIIEMPVQIGDATECQILIDELREMNPAFVILDTLAKCNIGRDENDAAAMGLFTDGMEKVARALNAFVLTIHHNNKNGGARGSISIPANLDASVTMNAATGQVVTLHCDRVKGAPFDDFSLIGREVEIGETDKRGAPITSLVFEPTNAPAVTIPKADQTREQVFKVLQDAGETGLSAGDWCEKSGLSRPSFSEYRAALVRENRVNLERRIYTACISSVSSVSSVSDKTDNGYISSVSSGGALAPDKTDKTTGQNNGQKRRPNKNADSEFYPAPKMATEEEGDLI